jgi:hypothetical protein
VTWDQRTAWEDQEGVQELEGQSELVFDWENGGIVVNKDAIRKRVGEVEVTYATGWQCPVCGLIWSPLFDGPCIHEGPKWYCSVARAETEQTPENCAHHEPELGCGWRDSRGGTDVREIYRQG